MKLHLAVIGLLLFISLNSTGEEQPRQNPETKADKATSMPWEFLPLPGTIGYGGPFVGTHQGALIVAGGANFPDGPPWPVGDQPPGKKQWHDQVYILEPNESEWNTAFKLPRRLAYGASISTPDGLLFIGGSVDGEDTADVFRLKWDPAAKDVSFETLPSLPRPTSFPGAGLIDNRVYVTASHRGDTANRLDEKSCWMLDLDHLDRQTGWSTLPVWPGPPRNKSAVVVQSAGSDKKYLYLFSGMTPRFDADGNPDLARFEFFTDAYRFDPSDHSWSRIADLPVVKDRRDKEGTFDKKRRPVAASCAVPFDASHVLVFGGATGRYITRPIQDRPLFPVDVLAYHTRSNTWSRIGEMPVGVVTTKAAWWGDKVVIPSGEIRPGVRTAKVQAIQTENIQAVLHNP